MVKIKLHPQFQLNGSSYTKEQLKEQAYNFVKEGKGYEANVGEFLLDWLSPSVVLAISTSGSTGTPKQITIHKTHMVNSALATGSFFGLHAGDTALNCLPTEYIAGKMMLVRAMVLGLHITCIPPVSNPLGEHTTSYDFAAMVPFQLRNSMKGINAIRTLIVGGAPFSKDLKELIKNKSTTIYETYGMTETITHIAVKQINHLPEVISSETEDVFMTMANVTLTIDNRDCLVINAPMVSNHQIVTNDIVDLISDTQFKWVGRYDNVINSGGIKLIPEQIESILSKSITNRFFVAGVPDVALGEKLTLFVEGNLDVQMMSQKIHGLGALQKFEIPKDIITVPIFAETKNGKINRLATLKKVIG